MTSTRHWSLGAKLALVNMPSIFLAMPSPHRNNREHS